MSNTIQNITADAKTVTIRRFLNNSTHTYKFSFPKQISTPIELVYKIYDGQRVKHENCTIHLRYVLQEDHVVCHNLLIGDSSRLSLENFQTAFDQEIKIAEATNTRSKRISRSP